MSERAILVVDDDPFIRKVMTTFLETAGHRPMAVGDSQKALELYAARSFDLVLTDYEMPVMSGSELARRMRTLRTSTPICLVTGSIEDVDASELEIFNGVLTKPFKQAELLDLVVRALPCVDEDARIVTRPQRYPVDWRVDCIPLEASTLTGEALEQCSASLCNVSEHGLAFVADEAPSGGKFCAFLIYPPEAEAPSLMVGEVRWSQDRDGRRVFGTRSLFWGSEQEKELVIEQAM